MKEILEMGKEAKMTDNKETLKAKENSGTVDVEKNRGGSLLEEKVIAQEMNEKKRNDKKRVTTRDLILMALFISLIVVGAFLKIPLPYISISMQSFFVLLAGVILGWKKGLIAVLIYIFMGLVGLPVFTAGGGFSYVFQPSFGFLLGFAVAVFLVGFLVEKFKARTFKKLLIICILGSLAVYVIGIPYLVGMSTLYFGKTLEAKVVLVNYFLLTLPGDLIKSVVVAIIGKRILPML